MQHLFTRNEDTTTTRRTMGRLPGLLAAALCLGIASPALAGTVDFSTATNNPDGSITSGGVTFSSTDPSPNLYVAAEAGVLVFSTYSPGSAAKTLTITLPNASNGVSLEIQDTEHSFTLRAYGAGGLLETLTHANAAELGSYWHRLTFASSGITTIEIEDFDPALNAPDGFYLDNLVFDDAPPPPPLCQLVDDLIADVANGTYANAGRRRSLLAKLEAASATLCDGDPSNDGQAAGPLGAFQNELAAQSGKSVDAALAAALSAEAQAIIDAITP